MMEEGATPAAAGPVSDEASGAREAIENRVENAPAVDDLPAAFEKAVDEMMGGFDARLAEVHRRLDGVLERRR